MRRLCWAIIASFFFSGVLTGIAQAQEWNEVRSPNLRMLTAGSPKQARDILWKFEQDRIIFGHLLSRAKVNRNRPLLILGLPSGTEVHALVGSTQTVSGGFALAAPERNYLVGDLSTTDWSGLHRAFALLMLDANYPRAQPWFDEGIAEYIAGMDIEAKQISVGVPPDVRRTLESGTSMRIEQLIAPDVETSPQFRAGAWLLVRWLIDTGQFENIGPYLNQVMNRGVAPAEAFQQVFATPPAAMDGVLAKFQPSALAPKVLGKPAELDVQTFTISKFPEDDARALEAQLRVDLPSEHEQGVATLRQLLAKDPDSAEVNRGLGIALLREGDKNAADFIRRAIEIRDDNALMHYLISVWRNRGSGGAIQVDSEAPTIAMQCQKAIDLDPEFASSYQLLAEALIATEHPEKALAAIRSGMAIAPRNEDLQLTFASVQVANGKLDEARGLLKFLQSSQNPAVTKRASEMLASVKHLKKNERNLAEQAARYSDPTSPKWKPKEEDEKANAQPEEEAKNETASLDTRKTEYVKGTLLKVECPDERSALLTVLANRKTWRFDVADRSKTLLIGSDKFECTWKDVPVSINYKASGPLKGDIVSLEVD